MTGKKSILVLSTLDTKGEETRYVKDRLADLGMVPQILDLSMGGKGAFPAEFPAKQVAQAGGGSIEEIRRSRDRARITRTITAGASAIAVELVSKNQIHGVVGIGGSTGSLMACDVMRSLPFGIPKLMVSSTAALPGLSTRYIGTADIVLFHSVIEISGLTDLLKNVIDRAVFAMAGMVEDAIFPALSGQGKRIALTMLGPCEKCASAVRKGLEKTGFQVIGFSAAGIGDRAMEEMIQDGFFHGVVDLAPGGVGEHLFGFMRDAGPDRMESAGKKGIPQIISTCSVNHMTPAKSKYKPEYLNRPKYHLDKHRTWIRLSEEELQQVARVFAEKLNKAVGPVRVLVPSKGWSAVDAPGNPSHDPAADQRFLETLRSLMKPEIRVLEVEANMEDPSFAEAILLEAETLFRAC
ncbi:MAG: Tm-1-like ATP-binding domain-containing protein [Deltaproteobacteria bacterium]|nr:Tm-1-like ATP-binding domain-containing protein [Deltaproteobacteria bacterium]